MVNGSGTCSKCSAGQHSPADSIPLTATCTGYSWRVSWEIQSGKTNKKIASGRAGETVFLLLPVAYLCQRTPGSACGTVQL